jgi:hypothetical protein
MVSMVKLENIICPKCGILIESDNYTPNSRGGAPPATYFDACLRRCNECGIGYSNAQNPSSVVKIYRNPLDNIPPEVHNGALETLSNALNKFNRENKLKKFAFETSEDAVTWTVFNYLKQKKFLSESLKLSGVDWLISTDIEPTILLWGVPVPGADRLGINIKKNLLMILDQIGEDPKKYSEPDVILDLGDIGVVIIEVKYRSPNDSLNEKSPKWEKYLHNSSAFADIIGVKKTGYYELARNWRIAWDLAGGRSMALINLGPDDLFKGNEDNKMQEFSRYLNQDEKHKFVNVTWAHFLVVVSENPIWFDRYLKERDLLA